MNKTSKFTATQGIETMSAREKNRLRVFFIIEHGMCEETLKEIATLSEDENVLLDTIATGLTKKYLYEPPMLDNGMAELIKNELCELVEKYDTSTANKMIAETLYDDINGIKYARGAGRIIENLRKLNTL